MTVTCNSQWPEILNEMKNCQNSDKLTIIARVFRMKLQAILDDIYKNDILGKVQANMHVIEFQKRGLPHAHILIILDEDSKPRNSDDYDQIVCAELPDPILHPAAYETVTSCMIHGPCGLLNPKSPCMIDGKCSKQFPKQFNENTRENIDGYPEYRRRDNGSNFLIKKYNNQHKNKELNYDLIYADNRWIVPYNLYLATKYNCHINVEICSSVSLTVIFLKSLRSLKIKVIYHLF